MRCWIPKGYIKEAAYQFSSLYSPGKSSNSWVPLWQGGTNKTWLTHSRTYMQLYIYRCIKWEELNELHDMCILSKVKISNIICIEWKWNHLWWINRISNIIDIRDNEMQLALSTCQDAFIIWFKLDDRAKCMKRSLWEKKQREFDE